MGQGPPLSSLLHGGPCSSADGGLGPGLDVGGPSCWEAFWAMSPRARLPSAPARQGEAAPAGGPGGPGGLRLRVWTEDQLHRPVWTEAAHVLRGVPSVLQLAAPLTRSRLARAFETLHGMETRTEDLRCYLLPDGGLVEDPGPTLRDGDRVLLRGGPVGTGTRQEGRRVTVQVKVLGLSRVDTVAQTFYADFVVVLAWREECLVGISEDRVDWDLVFHPALDIRNAYELEEVSKFGEKGLTRLRSSDGQVTAVYRFKGVLSQPMDLEAFPFDTQHLSICISTRGQNTKEVVLTPSDGAVVLPPDATWSLPDWKLCQCELVGHRTDPSHSMHGSVYTLVEVQIRAERVPTFYLMNIVAILVGIVSISFISFLFGQDALSDRLNLNCTLLLAAVGFKSYVADALPKISLLTALDRYVVGIFGFLYLVILENGAVQFLAIYVGEGVARSVDRLCFVLCAALFVVLHLQIRDWIRRAQRREADSVQQREAAAGLPNVYSAEQLDKAGGSEEGTPPGMSPLRHLQGWIRRARSARGSLRQPPRDGDAAMLPNACFTGDVR